MSGDCPECGEKLVWAGMSWAEHSPQHHDGVQRRLLGAVARLMAQEVRDGLLAAQAGAQGLVGIRMKSGVYRGLVMWHTVSRDFWDEPGPLGRDGLLRHLRSSSSDGARWKYGVDVNPATWTHTIYDGRQT